MDNGLGKQEMSADGGIVPLDEQIKHLVQVVREGKESLCSR